MYKLLIALALVLPLTAGATFDNQVTIDPVEVEICGSQELTFSGEFFFASGLTNANRKLEVKLDDDVIYTDNSNPAFSWQEWSDVNTVDVGEHEVTAKIYTTGVGAGVKDTASVNFVVEECEIPEPIDVCENLEGNQESVPEGYELVEGSCVPVEPEEEEPTDEEPEEDNGGGSSEEGGHTSSSGGYSCIFFERRGLTPPDHLNCTPDYEQILNDLVDQLLALWNILQNMEQPNPKG